MLTGIYMGYNKHKVYILTCVASTPCLNPTRKQQRELRSNNNKTDERKEMVHKIWNDYNRDYQHHNSKNIHFQVQAEVDESDIIILVASHFCSFLAHVKRVHLISEKTFFSREYSNTEDVIFICRHLDSLQIYLTSHNGVK